MTEDTQDVKESTPFLEENQRKGKEKEKVGSRRKGQKTNKLDRPNNTSPKDGGPEYVHLKGSTRNKTEDEKLCFILAFFTSLFQWGIMKKAQMVRRVEWPEKINLLICILMKNV